MKSVAGTSAHIAVFKEKNMAELHVAHIKGVGEMGRGLSAELLAFREETRDVILYFTAKTVRPYARARGERA